MAIRLGIDIGGTFTDFVLLNEREGLLAVYKTPSTPHDPTEAVFKGLASLLERRGIRPMDIAFLGHGTTIAANALIEGKTAPTALLTTEGFRDLLEIGRQRRPSLYDLNAEKPPPLVPRERRFEVRERLLSRGKTLIPLDTASVRAAAEHIKAEDLKAVAVCFLHSYANLEHELRAVSVLRDLLGEGVFICASSELLPEFREYERLSTTVLNASLGPIVEGYLSDLEEGLKALGVEAETLISLSNGGLSTIAVARRTPLRTILSGPAAGVAAAVWVGVKLGISDLITLDVGGTSADVALVRGGRAIETTERELMGYPARFPSLDVNTIGAGGGSLARVDEGGLLKVGPQSAGSRPGPACYGLGGERPTVTDACLILGYLDPQAPLGGSLQLKPKRAEDVMRRQIGDPLGMSLDEAALGVLDVMAANVVRAIWAISVERGIDPRDFALMAYGGAGPMHAARIAEELGLSHVIVPPAPGNFCALGLLVECLKFDFVQTLIAPLAEGYLSQMNRILTGLRSQGEALLDRQRVPKEARRFRYALDLRYRGQDYELTVPLPKIPLDSIIEIEEAFHQLHRRSYGYALRDRDVQVVNLRLTVEGELPQPELPRISVERARPKPCTIRHAIFRHHGSQSTPVYRRGDLPAGFEHIGPLIVEEPGATTVVPPGAHLGVDGLGCLHLRLSLREGAKA